MKNKKMKQVTRIIASMLIMSTVMCSCGDDESGINQYTGLSKSQLISVIEQIQLEKEDISLELYDYKKLMNKLDDTGNAQEVSVMADGSGQLTFHSYDSKIVFPSSFVYPNAKEIAATSTTYIVPSVSVSPNSNWITRIEGSTMELEHTNGISGLIKVGSIDKPYDRNKFQAEVMVPWFSEVSKYNVKYSTIFIQNMNWGTQGQTNINIDNEPAYLKCGMFAFSDYCVTYIFVYRGVQDATKDEPINSVINSIKILNQNITVD